MTRKFLIDNEIVKLVNNLSDLDVQSEELSYVVTSATMISSSLED